VIQIAIAQREHLDFIASVRDAPPDGVST